MTRFAGQHKGITNFLGAKPNYSGMGADTTRAGAEEQINKFDANAKIANSQTQAVAQVEAANHWADATRAGASAQAQAGMVGDIASGIGSFAPSLFSSGSSTGGTGSGYSGYKFSDFGSFSPGAFG